MEAPTPSHIQADLPSALLRINPRLARAVRTRCSNSGGGGNSFLNEDVSTGSISDVSFALIILTFQITERFAELGSGAEKLMFGSTNSDIEQSADLFVRVTFDVMQDQYFSTAIRQAIY